jgi:hypothetical protein
MFGYPHDRCKAHKRDKTPCMQYAMSAQYVCKMHGGMTPAAIAMAKRTQAKAEMLSRVSKIVSYKDDTDTPEEGLLREVSWSGQIAIALGEACETLVNDSELRSKSAGAGHQYNALMEAWTKERINHARLCSLALQAGIQQRQLDLVESQANQIVAAMSSLLMSPRLGLSAEQIIEGRIVAAGILRSLLGAAQALPMPMSQ